MSRERLTVLDNEVRGSKDESNDSISRLTIDWGLKRKKKRRRRRKRTYK